MHVFKFNRIGLCNKMHTNGKVDACHGKMKRTTTVFFHCCVCTQKEEEAVQTSRRLIYGNKNQRHYASPSLFIFLFCYPIAKCTHSHYHKLLTIMQTKFNEKVLTFRCAMMRFELNIGSATNLLQQRQQRQQLVV